MGICLDLSHWDWPTANTEEKFRLLAERGVSDVIIGGNPNFPDEANAMIQLARDAGIYVGALYNFVYFGLDHDLTWARYNAFTAKRNNIARVYQDCESEFYGPGNPHNTEAPGLTAADRISELERILFLTGSEFGRAHGIYTNRWWVSKMANTTRYQGLPLWLAHWASADEYVPFEKFDADFGGWTANAIHQYTSLHPGLIRDRRDANHIHNSEDWYVDVLEEITKQREEIDRLNRLVAGYGWGRNPDGTIHATGEHALAAADADGSSLFLGLGDTQADVAKLKAAEAEFLTIAPGVAADSAPGDNADAPE